MTAISRRIARIKAYIDKQAEKWTNEPATWGVRFDPPKTSLDDGGYDAPDVDTTPDFVKRDNEGWTTISKSGKQ